MLQGSKLKTLQELIDGSSRDELIWMNGYISGLVAPLKDTNGNGQNGHGTVVKKISIVFGTETGNSKKLATDLATLAKQKGISVKVTGVDQYRLADLDKEEFFFVVISTHGEGEPPGPA